MSTALLNSDTAIANFSTPSDQYAESPNLTGVKAGTTSAVVNLTANSCTATGVGSPPPAVPACPTSISLLSAKTMPLSNQLSRWLTGIGVVTAMQLNGSPSPAPNFDDVYLSETVSQTSTTCTNMANLCTDMLGSFDVGVGMDSVDGESWPGKTNAFYDQHARVDSKNDLVAAGLQSCTSVCKQSYVCGGEVVGNFTITYNLARQTINSTQVTSVAVTKQAQ